MFDGTNCTDEINFGRYITEFECQGLRESDHILKDARLSFPSGHSSFSFFTMVYLAVSLYIYLCLFPFILNTKKNSYLMFD